MIKSLQRATLILALAGGTLTALTGCFPLVAGGMVTGALVASDRRTTGTVAEDQGIEVKAANRIQLFFRIVTPISLPAYASVAIIIFTQVWNEFFLALTLASRDTQTVQVVMAEAKGTTLVLYNLQMAAALIAIAIPLIFFLLLGRYFIRGILAGALKG